MRYPVLRGVAWAVVAALVYSGSIACPYTILLTAPYLRGLVGGCVLVAVPLSLALAAAVFLSLPLGGFAGYDLSGGRRWLYATIFATTATAMALATLVLHGEGIALLLAPVYAVLAGAQTGFAYVYSKL